MNCQTCFEVVTGGICIHCIVLTAGEIRNVKELKLETASFQLFQSDDSAEDACMLVPNYVETFKDFHNAFYNEERLTAAIKNLKFAEKMFLTAKKIGDKKIIEEANLHWQEAFRALRLVDAQISASSKKS